MRTFVLDTSCFIDASRSPAAAVALETFSVAAAPGLWLSSVVAAELQAGARTRRDRERLDKLVLRPYRRRGRLLTPSAASWEALGTTLATLTQRDGLDLRRVPRSFIFDILIAHSCREAGATLVSPNVRDMDRIGRVFEFKHAEPYPELKAEGSRQKAES
jgi:predicted nucleic acid-binding protein